MQPVAGSERHQPAGLLLYVGFSSKPVAEVRGLSLTLTSMWCVVWCDVLCGFEWRDVLCVCGGVGWGVA